MGAPKLTFTKFGIQTPIRGLSLVQCLSSIYGVFTFFNFVGFAEGVQALWGFYLGMCFPTIFSAPITSAETIDRDEEI